MFHIYQLHFFRHIKVTVLLLGSDFFFSKMSWWAAKIGEQRVGLNSILHNTFLMENKCFM